MTYITHRKGPVPSRGITYIVQARTQSLYTEKGRYWHVDPCPGVQARAQGIHTEKYRYRFVDPRPEAYRHVHKAYTEKRVGTGTWIHIQRPKRT